MTFIQRLGLKNMPQEQREGSDLVLNILISFFPQCLSFGFRVQSHFKSMTPRQHHILEFRARVFLVSSTGNRSLGKLNITYHAGEHDQTVPVLM